MKKLRWLALLILVSSCDYLTQVKLLKNGEVGVKNYFEEIPFELKKGLIIVKGRLNNDSSYREFIFDTGAFDCKIEKSLANSLGMPSLATRDNSTASGISQELEITRVNQFKMGEIPFQNISAGKLEYDKASASPCLAAHGLVGANLIRLAHWKVDFQNQMLSFSDSAFQPERFEVQHRLPFDHEKLTGIPEVNLEIEGKAVSGLIFDLGYNGGIVLPLQLAGKFPGPIEQIILDQSTSGIFGSNPDSIIVKRLQVEIDGFNQIIPIEFSSLGKGLIGTEFLEHFQIILNYQKKEILLLQQEEVKIPKALKFIPGIDLDGNWIVDRTTPDLPLNLGQKILTINGKKPGDIFTSHCDYVLKIRDFLNQEVLELRLEDGTLYRIGI